MKILAAEGMGNFPCVENQLIKPFLATHPNAFDVKFFAWDDPLFMDYKADIGIGHSLSGSRIQDWARIAKPKAIIVLDARRTDGLSWFDILFPWRNPFPAVLDVDVHNFMHWPAIGFPGYPVEGAVENTRLFCNHGDLPGQKAVFQCLSKLLSKYNS